jgi:KaiC/GvpD/RAD55 family RecA-like ATPase
MATRLSAEEAQARVQQVRADSSTSPLESARSPVTPNLPTCSEIAERLITDAKDMSNRWSLGVHEIDDAMDGGIKRREMMVVAGKAHTGKTVLIVNAVAKNPNSIVMWMSPDEPDLMVLSKILSVRLNLSPRHVYDLARRGDKQILAAIRHQSETELVNLRIIDRATIGRYQTALRIAGAADTDMVSAIDHMLGTWSEENYGRKPDVFIWDFASQLYAPELGDDPAKIGALKHVGMQNDAATIVIHQASRGTAARGTALGIESGRYGGEDLAHFMITVWRPHEEPGLDHDERTRLESVFGVALVKNKRFDGRKVSLQMEITESGTLVDPWQEIWLQQALDDE